MLDLVMTLATRWTWSLGEEEEMHGEKYEEHIVPKCSLEENITEAVIANLGLKRGLLMAVVRAVSKQLITELGKY